MPIVFGKLIEFYGWKGSLIIVAGLQLHLILCAALLRSPPASKRKKHSQAEALLDGCEATSAVAVSEDPHSLAAQEGTTCKAKSAVLEDSKAVMVGSESLATCGASAMKDKCKEFFRVNALGSSPSGNEALVGGFSADASGKNTCHDSTQKLATGDHTNSTDPAKDSDYTEKSVFIADNDINSTDPVKDSHYTESTVFIANKVQPGGEEIKDAEVENSLVEKADMPLSNHFKVLRHIYLFTDVGFDVYFISSILWNATAAMVLSFGPEFITEHGISDMDSAWLLTIFGFGDFVGGVIGGVIGNIWVKHRQMQYILANVLFGVCVATLPFGSTFGEFAAILFCGGLVFGVVLGLLVVVLIDIIGSDNLGDGLGYIMLANGLGAFAGPGLAGTFIFIFHFIQFCCCFLFSFETHRFTQS